jgi:HNH endonuclease
VSKRKGLSKRLRFSVFKRDLFTCQYCGATPPRVVLEVDHIEPVAEGGSDDESNLVTACFDCNRGKAAISLSVVPESLADRAARVAEAEEQLAGYREIMREQEWRREEDVWLVFDALEGKRETTRANFESVRQFLKRLPLEDVVRAGQIAQARMGWKGYSTRFRYFCGVCWRMIKGESDVEG